MSSAQTAQEPAAAQIWEDALSGLFGDLSELPTVWRDAPRPAVFPSQRGLCTLFVSSDRVVGVPETRLSFPATPPVGAEIEPSIVEVHLLELLVGVETYDHRARERGRFFASRIRTRLRRESARLALEKVSTSMIDVGPVLSASLPVDGRMSSASTIVVRLHTATCERDKTFGYIETVRLVPSLEDEAGGAISSPPIDVVIPSP